MRSRQERIMYTPVINGEHDSVLFHIYYIYKLVYEYA